MSILFFQLCHMVSIMSIIAIMLLLFELCLVKLESIMSESIFVKLFGNNYFNISKVGSAYHDFAYWFLILRFWIFCIFFCIFCILSQLEQYSKIQNITYFASWYYFAYFAYFFAYFLAYSSYWFLLHILHISHIILHISHIFLHII